MEFIRICPKCNNKRKYKNKISFNKAVKINKPCASCAAKERVKIHGSNWNIINKAIKDGIRKNGFKGKSHSKSTIEKLKLADKSYTKTDDFKKTMSKVTSGSNNPMSGKSVYNVWIEKYGKEIADKKHNQFKDKLSKAMSGENNPMYGKISPTGSGNGWSGWYKDFYFRSLLELSYMINMIERFNLNWESAEQRKYTIKYKDHKGTERTYRADFIVNGKYMIEIKPKKLWNSKIVQSKANAAIKFCKENGLKYKLVDTRKLSINEVKQLHALGNIKFIKRYEEKFKKLYDKG